jgi:uncharacterized protein YodC (DUF2158 family)
MGAQGTTFRVDLNRRGHPRMTASRLSGGSKPCQWLNGPSPVLLDPAMG